MLEFFNGIPKNAPLVTRLHEAKAKAEFPCLSCHGTGNWSSPSGRSNGQCFACKGTGKHAKPHREVMAAKAKRKVAIASGKQERRHEFQEADPELFRFMAECQWSYFIRDMFAIVCDGRTLTERQLAACVATKAKSDARVAVRRVKQVQDAAQVDFSKIETMFDAAKAKGLKKLAYRAEGITLTPAKANGKNPGAIYVVDSQSKAYLGKVTGGRFIATDAATAEHKATVGVIAANPSKAAKDFGKRTGTCCCCGRELTDPVSIENGIGPICAQGWGL